MHPPGDRPWAKVWAQVPWGGMQPAWPRSAGGRQRVGRCVCHWDGRAAAFVGGSSTAPITTSAPAASLAQPGGPGPSSDPCHRLPAEPGERPVLPPWRWAPAGTCVRSSPRRCSLPRLSPRRT